MAHRSVEQKKRRRVAKSLRRKPLPAFIDPVQWLLDRRLVKTKREARVLILDGRLKSESHAVGIGDGMVADGLGYKPGKVVALVPAERRGSLRVVA